MAIKVICEKCNKIFKLEDGYFLEVDNKISKCNHCLKWSVGSKIKVKQTKSYNSKNKTFLGLKIQKGCVNK